jgi:dGTPase
MRRGTASHLWGAIMEVLYTELDRKRQREVIEHEGYEREEYRTAWRRDYARLIHSAAFRRLQGKTQLFPGMESDFFRNRLTHSLEVAQIAKSIALRLNHTESFFSGDNAIDTDLVETAALAHDLGHPPFGHNGEIALDRCMLKHGGFEGNAQTLRILCRLEKKETQDFPPSDRTGAGYYLNIPKPVNEAGTDLRHGLNLAYRTLAAVLKYDKKIPKSRSQGTRKLTKGYYYTEADVVKQIKKHVGNGKRFSIPFKTIECQIMDLADDIAYSTYDLEDAFKGKFLTPLDMLSSSDELLEKVGNKVAEALEDYNFDKKRVKYYLDRLYADEFQWIIKKNRGDSSGQSDANTLARIVTDSNNASNNVASVGYIRTDFTSRLVGRFIRAVKVEVNESIPALSKVFLDADTQKEVEVLKRYAYCALIMSPRLKIVQIRGKEIVESIFDTLAGNAVKKIEPDSSLLPIDFQRLYVKSKTESEKRRVVCDYIAGMTDKYAVEFYGRLKSENPQTIFKPF